MIIKYTQGIVNDILPFKVCLIVTGCIQYAVQCNPAVCFRDDRSCEGAEGEERQRGGEPSSHQGAPERADQGLENIAVLTQATVQRRGWGQGVYHSECIVARDCVCLLLCS